MPVTLSIPLTGIANDGYWRSSGVFDPTTTIRIGYDGSTGNIYTAFFRFKVPVFHGSTITSAKLKITEKNIHPGIPVSVTIRGSNEDNSTLPTSASTGNAAPKTVAFSSWINIPHSGNLQVHTSPDIANIIQETIDRAGWQYDNFLTLYLLNQGLVDYLGLYPVEELAGSAVLEITLLESFIETPSGGIEFGNSIGVEPSLITPGIKFGGEAAEFIHYDLPVEGTVVGFGGEIFYTIGAEELSVSGGIEYGGDAVSGMPQTTYGSFWAIAFGGDVDVTEFIPGVSPGCGVSRAIVSFGIYARVYSVAPVRFGIAVTSSAPLTFGIVSDTPSEPRNPLACYLSGGNVLVVWDKSLTGVVDHYQIWVADNLDGPYDNFGNDFFAPTPDNFTVQRGIVQNLPPIGASAWFQIRAVSPSGLVSDWVQVNKGVVSKPQTVMRCTAPTDSVINAGARFITNDISNRLIGFMTADELNFTA